MGASTKIQWTDSTWNPLIAYDKEQRQRGWFCVPVSDGCKNCYASTMNANKRPMGNGIEFKAQNANKVDLELHLPTIEKMAKSGKEERVFVCSMTDLFYEGYTHSQILIIFAVMSLCPKKTFQVLTKRSERMMEMVGSPFFQKEVRAKALQIMPNLLVKHRLPSSQWPLPNVWLGVTAENQKAADERIPLLTQTPAVVRFVSYEPALEYVDFGDMKGLDWIIVGGESGDQARPFNVGWATAIIDACEKTGVAVFVKQMGQNPEFMCSTAWTGLMSDKHGGDWDEWPSELRVRQFPLDFSDVLEESE
jgi:protein gp37